MHSDDIEVSIADRNQPSQQDRIILEGALVTCSVDMAVIIHDSSLNPKLFASFLDPCLA